MIARASPRTVAKLQARDVERAVARSSVLAARLWRMSSDAARRIRAGRLPEFSGALQQAVLDELLDVMALSYLTRFRLDTRRRSVAKSVKLELASPVHDEARRVADRFDLNLGNIRKRFEPTARAAVRRTASDIRDTMNRALARATREGKPTGDAVRDVIRALRRHGIQPKRDSYVEALVRTHSAIAYGAAHRLSFEGDTDLWGWEYVTVGDERVRPEHEDVEGVRRKVGDPFWDTWWPPNGWNCRCQAVAIYDPDTRQTRVPSGAEPDDGFDFDPAELVR